MSLSVSGCCNCTINIDANSPRVTYPVFLKEIFDIGSDAVADTCPITYSKSGSILFIQWSMVCSISTWGRKAYHSKFGVISKNLVASKPMLASLMSGDSTWANKLGINIKISE